MGDGLSNPWFLIVSMISGYRENASSNVNTGFIRAAVSFSLKFFTFNSIERFNYQAFVLSFIWFYESYSNK